MFFLSTSIGSQEIENFTSLSDTLAKNKFLREDQIKENAKYFQDSTLSAMLEAHFSPDFTENLNFLVFLLKPLQAQAIIVEHELLKYRDLAEKKHSIDFSFDDEVPEVIAERLAQQSYYGIKREIKGSIIKEMITLIENGYLNESKKIRLELDPKVQEIKFTISDKDYVKID